MLTFPLNLLLMVVSLPIIVVMPQSFPSGESVYPIGENMTHEEHCQQLFQSPDPLPLEKMPWYCLCMHCQNSKGTKGNTGDQGLPGSPASPGIQGITGYHGPPGYSGGPGIKGQKGASGEKGQQGQQGLEGPIGTGGFKGDTGDPGLKGYHGDPGLKGDDGVCPDTCESSFGPPGIPGLPGPVGLRGLSGITGQGGPKGNKGDKGNFGDLGAHGHVGQKGELGPLGECNCVDGLDGPPGQEGEMGDKGDQGQVGPEGMTVQGNKGNKGSEGGMGEMGLCFSLTISAFSAWLQSSFPLHNKPVVFSGVLFNENSNYNSATGIYTAPINGTYVFSYDLTVERYTLKVGLFLNYKSVVKNTNQKTFGKTSHLIILPLTEGDKVWIQVKDLLSNGLYAGPETKSTFSGFLLYPDNCNILRNGNPVRGNNVQGVYSWV